jgi:hypothetical protein
MTVKDLIIKLQRIENKDYRVTFFDWKAEVAPQIYSIDDIEINEEYKCIDLVEDVEEGKND